MSASLAPNATKVRATPVGTQEECDEHGRLWDRLIDCHIRRRGATLGLSGVLSFALVGVDPAITGEPVGRTGGSSRLPQ